GGERDQIASTGGESGQRNRIVSRRVHENESRRSDAFRVIDGVVQWRRSRFGDRTQRFLKDVRQPARLVAWRGVVVEAAAESRQILLVSTHESEQPFGNGAASRPANQEMLRAENFGRFGERGRSTGLRDQVRTHAQRRIRRNSRKGIRSAAVQSENDLR